MDTKRLAIVGLALASLWACQVPTGEPVSTAVVGEDRAVAPSALDKAVILSMTSCKENSTTNLQYTYAEKLGSADGRGITFGIIGFTSGTFDGTILIQHIKDLDPTNVLVKYLPAFQAIDKLSHPDGKTNNTTGLGNFIKDFNAHGGDAKVKQAQMDELNSQYWDPAVAKANEIGAKYTLTLEALYDACVNHGADGDSSDKGLKQLVADTNKSVKTHLQGGDETTWLNKFLSVRKAYMSKDPLWKLDLDRVAMTQGQVNAKNFTLKPGFSVKVNDETFTITGKNVY